MNEVKKWRIEMFPHWNGTAHWEAIGDDREIHLPNKSHKEMFVDHLTKNDYERQPEKETENVEVWFRDEEKVNRLYKEALNENVG